MLSRNGAFTATVVMVRRTLEGVCVEHGIDDTPLVKALKRMQDAGLIEGRLVEWAQSHVFWEMRPHISLVLA